MPLLCTMDSRREVARSNRRGGELYATLTQNHRSTYLHDRQTKLGINDFTSLVSAPLPISVSLLSLSVTSYMHKHTTRVLVT
jgi:hypothetical protein